MAAMDLERLVVQLSADVRSYEKEMRRAQGITTRRMGAIQKDVFKSSAAIASSFTRAGAAIAAGLAAGGATRAAIQLADAATKIENSLKVAGLAGEDLQKVYQGLFESAQRNAAPIESLVTLYSRLALTQKELGVSQQELINFSDKIALALRVGGTSATEASGALLQLSQALGGGIVRAEEFNSILEGAPTIAQAAAAGLKEAGGSVAALRTLVVDGKVSSEAFFRAFEAGAVTLEQKVAGAESTTSQGFVRLQNVLIDTAGSIDDATGASEKLGKGINELAEIIKDFGRVVVQASESDLASFLGWLNSGLDKVNEFKRVMGGLSGVFLKMNQFNNEAFRGLPLGSTLNADTIQSRIDDAFAVTATPPLAKGGRLPQQVEVKPVSIEDYRTTGSSKGKKGSSGRQDDFERETQQIRKRTEALQSQTAAQASVNPLINDYGYAVEYAAARQDLLTAAQDAGVKVTPQLEASIDGLASGYARAVVASERLAEQQDEIRQRAEDAMATARDLAGGLADDLLDGADAADVLANSLKRISSVLLNDVLDSIFKVNKSSGQSLIGSIFGGLGGIFGGASGGDPWSGMRVPSYNGGGGTGRGSRSGGLDGKGGFMAMLHPRETVIDHTKPSALSMPRLPDVSAVRAAASAPSITYAPTYDARGADSAAVARLELAMARDRADFDAKVLNSMRKAKNSLDWRGR